MKITENNWHEGYSLIKKIGLIDAHCDSVRYFGDKKMGYSFNKKNASTHVDLPKLEEGNIKGQFFAVCVESKGEPKLKDALSFIECYYQEIESNHSRIEHINTTTDMKKVLKDNKIFSLLALEGAGALEGEIRVLSQLFRLGVRCVSLTWNYRNQLADGIYENETGGGLTQLGKTVIKEVEKQGMLLDLSHLSYRGYIQALDVSFNTPLVSHANCFTLCSHPRNLSDEQIRFLAEKGGIMGISFYPPFISSCHNNVNLESLLNHFVYVANLVGVEYLAVGSDFDGINKTVEQISDASCMPLLAAGLLQKGFFPKEIEQILINNMYHLLEEVLPD